MKILLITTTYPTPTRPRQGLFNRVLVQALDSRHEVRVIAPIPWAQRLCGRISQRSHEDSLHPTYFYPPKILREQYHQFYWRSIRASIRQLERTFVPEVVLGYWLHPDGAAAVRAAAHFDVPSIVMSGGSDLRLLPRHSRRREAIRRVLADAARVVVFSRELGDRACQLGTRPGSVDVVYRGVDRRCFHPMSRIDSRRTCDLEEDAVVVLWAGRLTDVKNPHMLLHAAVRWHAIWGCRLQVLLAGDGPLRNQLVRLAHQLKLDGVVRFVGNWTAQELALGYNAADVTVLTSRSEGVPNVLLESIACETAFVATDVGGVAEIATTGLDQLVPCGNIDALAEAVVQQLRTRPSSPRAFVPQDLNGMADQFDAVLARTLGTTGSTRENITTRSPAVHFSEPVQGLSYR